jgi:stress-induced morphogen
MGSSSSLRHSYPFIVLSFLIIGMISSLGARAFTTVVTRSMPGQRMLSAAATNNINTARFMSSTPPSAPDTSVVENCTKKIGDALETTDVKVTGAYDDPNGSHISIEVVSPLFEGKRAMQRQQLVYKAIWEELKGPVHAGMFFF